MSYQLLELGVVHLHFYQTCANEFLHVLTLLCKRRWQTARTATTVSSTGADNKHDPAVMKRLIQLGLPIALALFFEVTLFAVVALLFPESHVCVYLRTLLTGVIISITIDINDR